MGIILWLFALYSYADDTQVRAIVDFKPNLYLGKWYEIARIPFSFEKNCIALVTAEYTMEGNNIAVKNSCNTNGNAMEVATGMAYFNESTEIGKLKVTFVPSWLRFTHIGRADYWIIYTDYDLSLVGSPNHKYLWILSRSESPDPTKIKMLLSIADSQGFETTKLLFNYKGIN